MWVVGSSIVKDAFIAARRRPGGVNLGLDRLNVSIWWQGKGGMVISQLRQHINIMRRYEDPPDFLVIHIAGNDLGHIKVGHLRNEIKNTLRMVINTLPNTKLVWSQILPRLKWRYSSDVLAMQTMKYRINNSISAFILRSNGCYIRHPDIRANHNFLKTDGVHLTPLGNDIFLNNIQGGLEYFIQHPELRHVFPA